MSAPGPIDAFWDNEAEVFRPASNYWARRAAKQFAAGEILHLEHVEERSGNSHRHFFAAIQSAFDNLPPLWAEQFKSPEHLRRFCLIKAGICNSQSMPCGTAAAARKFAAFLRPMDEFAVVDVRGSVVTVFTAKSMSYKTMPKDEFQKAKTAVLDALADMLGVTTKELSASAPVQIQHAGAI